jgi:hypothetical protein
MTLRPKTKWKGNPTHLPVSFHEKMTENGRTEYYALLKCGHLVKASPSRLRPNGQGQAQATLSCDVCGYYLRRQEREELARAPLATATIPPKAAEVAVKQVTEMQTLMMNMAKMLAKFDDRLTQVEDVKTRPSAQLELLKEE